MKGCSKTKTKTRKNKLFLGGATDLRLAYPSKGPPSVGFDFLNPQTGGCNGQCAVNGGAVMKGGSKCACKACQKGGASLPYPNGLLGNAWTPSISGWPGVDGISMDRNHLGYNTYNNDISRQMRNVGANPPFTYLKGGKRRKTANKRSKNKRSKNKRSKNKRSKNKRSKNKRSKNKRSKNKRSKNKNNKRKSKSQKAGNNFLGQDLINVGRQLQYGVGSAYNGIRGYTAPVNPLPWKDQFK